MQEDKTVNQTNVDADEDKNQHVDELDNAQSVANDQGNDNNSDDDDSGAGAAGEQTPAPTTRSQKRHSGYIDRITQDIASQGLSVQKFDNKPNDYQELDYRKSLDFGDDQKVYEQLENDRKAYGENQRRAAEAEANKSYEPIRLQQWADRLDIDNERISAKYDFLNPESDNFNEDYADGMTKMYYSYIGLSRDKNGNINVANPNVRYRDFVEAQQNLSEMRAAQASEATALNITKQAGKTGVRPNGASRTASHGFDPNDQMSISKMSRDQWNKGGREAAQAEINRLLGN